MEGLGGGQAGDDTAMGRAASGVVAMYAELPSLGPVWERAPLQALAKMHTLVAVPVTPEDVGRPVPVSRRIRCTSVQARRRRRSPARLTALAQRITAPTSAPALVVAAVVHAELMTLQPFTYGSGLVARAVDRLVLAGRGIDPDNWSVPEAGVHTQGRTTYARTLRGTPRAARSRRRLGQVLLRGGGCRYRRAGSAGAVTTDDGGCARYWTGARVQVHPAPLDGDLHVARTRPRQVGGRALAGGARW